MIDGLRSDAMEEIDENTQNPNMERLNRLGRAVLDPPDDFLDQEVNVKRI